MKIIRSAVALLLSLSLLLGTGGACALAADAERVYTQTLEDTGRYLSSGTQLSTLTRAIDLEAFKQYLSEQLYECTARIDISMYNLANSDENREALSSIIHTDIPEAFHVDRIAVGYTSTKLMWIEPEYVYTAEEYRLMYAECQTAANELLAGIENNPALTDVEKALLLHDRIALLCEYDQINYENGTTPAESYTIYGVLAKGVAVCQGYSETYMYLLDKVGIESTICDSDELNHAWNIVYIDGVPYHVDVTWDDPVRPGRWNLKGEVRHDNFLVSSAELYANDHDAYDYDTTPSDTRYDDYFWQNSEAAFQLIGDEIYYIDNVNETLNRYSDGEALCSVDDVWKAAANAFWPGNWARLASDGVHLYYSTADTIYEYDLVTEHTRQVLAPEMPTDAYYSIYGFSYENGYLVYDISDTPNCDTSTRLRNQMLLDRIAPTAAISAANEAASAQAVTLTLSDNASIAGYYWGTDADYFDNPYIETSSTEIDVTVSEAGTYYLTAQDIGGNVSETASATFYQTTLEANGGAVEPTYLITGDMTELTLPVPTREGYNFCGWAREPDAASGNDTIAVTANETYYAVWEEIPVVLTGVSIASLPDKIAYTVGETLDLTGFAIMLSYSDGSTYTVDDGFTLGEVDLSTPGEKEIAVLYEGERVTFTVTVAEPIDTAALAVEEQIAALVDEITSLEQTDDIAAVRAARDAYDALSSESQAKVSNLDRLTDLEAQIEALSVPSFILGDMDGSWTIDVADILKMKTLILNDQWTDADLAIGDMDQSGAVDVGDIMVVKNVIMGA